jgi:calcium/calmodulin-dependent protein kinase (CaM kinase) II
MSNTSAQEILNLTQQLLDSIAEGDWATYSKLCDPSITCIEGEALGHVVAGLEFHKFYFDLAGGASKPRNTICHPTIRVMGDSALIAYFRLTQYVDANGHPNSRGTEETRVWQRVQGDWRHVHFHRSPVK